MKKTLLIVNPVAGKMKAKSTLLDVIEELQKGDMEVTVKVTKQRGDAIEIAKTAKEKGYDLVACFGGDGTLNETMSGLLLSGAMLPLGYIPAGSTNDFAVSLKLPNVPKKAAEAIVKGNVAQIDIGCFDARRYFTYIAAFGAFTAASYNVSQDVKNVWGHLAYILGGVKELGNLRKYHVKLECDDRTIEDDFIFVSVSNSTSVAGIVKLKSELVDISDGVFEVGLVRMPKTIIELNKIISAITTSNFDKGGVEFFKASKVMVTSEEKLDWTLDGEHVVSEGQIVIENCHNALGFIR